MSESQIVVSYGDPKMGKTTDLGFTFPTGVFFAPSASSLLPLKQMAGLRPKTAVVKSLARVHQFIVDHAEDESISAIIIDDIALLADAAIKEWQAKAGNNGWFAYAEIKRVCQEMCVIARASPWHLVLDSHKKPPETTESGYFLKGGPILPGKQAGPEIMKNASIILRAEVGDPLDADSGATDAWAGVYVCDQSDPNWVTGDRNGFSLKSNPMNLREILHAGGVNLPYVYGWMPDFVEKLASLKTEGSLTSEVLDKALAKMRSLGAPETAVQWTLRDANDRAFMRMRKNKRTESLMKNLVG